MRDYSSDLPKIFGAWRVLMDLPVRGRDGARSGAAEEPWRSCRWFPLLATLNGLALAFCGGAVGLIANRYAGAAAFALLTLAYLVVCRSGKTWVVLVSWLLNLRDGRGFSGAVAEASSDRAELDRDWAAAVLAVLVLLALLMLFFLGLYGGKCFIAVVLTGAAAVRGELLFAAEEDRFSDSRRAARLVMWAGVAAAGLFWLFFFPLATLLSAVLVMLAVCWIGGALRVSPAELGGEAGLWTEAVAEALLLLCGFLWTLD